MRINSSYEEIDSSPILGPNQLTVILFLIGLILSLTMELKGVFSGLEIALFILLIHRAAIHGGSALSSPAMAASSTIMAAVLFFLLLSNGDSYVTAAMESVKVAIFFFSLIAALGTLKVCWLERLVLWAVWSGIATGSIIQNGLNVNGLELVAKHVSLPSYLLLLAWLACQQLPALRLALIPSLIAAVVAATTGETRSANGLLAIGISLALFCSIAPLLSRKVKILFCRWHGAVTFLFIIASVMVPATLAHVFWADIQYDPMASKSNVERSTMLIVATNSLLSNFHTGIGFDNGFNLLVRSFSSLSENFQATSSLHNMLFDAAFFGGFWISLAFAIFMTKIATDLLRIGNESLLSGHILGSLALFVGGMSVYAWSSQGRMYYLAIVLCFAGSQRPENSDSRYRF